MSTSTELSLQGWTALVTGASSGIGRAVCVALAKEGCNICGVARRQDKLEAVLNECQQYGVKTTPVLLDLAVASPKQIDDAVEHCVKQLGSLNILVNNAGVGGASNASTEEWQRCIQVNLIALMMFTKSSVPHLERNPRSALINIASVSGRMTMKNSAPYCASKHAVVGFTGSLFDDVREKGVKVCSIEPGFVATEMISDSPNLDRSKMLQPEDVAHSILFVVKFPETGCPTEIYLRPQRSPYHQ